MTLQAVFWSTRGELRYPVHVFNTHFDRWNPSTKQLGSHLATDEYIGMYLTGFTSKWMHWEVTNNDNNNNHHHHHQ